MTESRTTLLLTRPERDSEEFLAAIQERLGRDVPALISPVLRIEQVAETGDLAGFETVIVTSRNAVFLAGRCLKGRSVATVGQRTADAARAFGAKATCLGDDVEAFLRNIGELRGPAVHLRGVHGRDLAGRADVAVEERVIYDQVAQDLSGEARALLMSGKAVVPVFSPRSAALVSGNPVAASTLVVAISDTAKAAWQSEGRVVTATAPTREAMLDLVASAF